MKFIITSLIFSFFSLSLKAQETYPEYVYNLSKYIQFESTQYFEREAGEYLSDLCKQKGLHIEVLDTTDQSYNFVASLYPLSSNKPNIVLLNHIDVVSPGDESLWQYKPYSGEIADSIIWGRGAIDNKGMAIAQLYAIKQLANTLNGQELPFNVSMLCVSDEENGGHRGSMLIVNKHLEKLNINLILGEGGSGVKGLISSQPDKAVFGTSTIEKSKLVLKLVLELESSGHGSVPPKEYATKEMVFALQRLLNHKQEVIFSKVPVRALKQIGKEEKGLRGFVLERFTFFAFKPFVKKAIKNDPVIAPFFTNTMTLTNLSTSNTDHNQISSSIEAVLDCRLIPKTEPKQFIRQIKRRLNDKRIKVTPIHEEISRNRSFVPEYYSILCQSLDEIFPESLNLEIIFPATTDNYIFRNKGIPVFGIFPAIFSESELKCIHAENERISIESMEQSIQVYALFLQKLTKLSWDSDTVNSRGIQKDEK
jgi:carboxypeptidase PM20D1